MSAINLLREVLKASEKAANIARVCRQNPILFSLLVQEKSKDESNTRFAHDFKTLADCLIQEMIKHDIGKQFPELRDNIRGEENAKFTNTAGESIIVSVTDDPGNTTKALEKILNGDKVSAAALVDEVYREVEIDFESLELPTDSIPLDNDWSQLGIWIDPIDGTAEYIKGEEKLTKYSNIVSSGLKCCTVLIGVYETCKGTPILGVINQPFAEKISNQEEFREEYRSKIFWGLSVGDLKFNNIASQGTDARIAILSPSEQSKYVEFIRNQLKYDVVYSSGAGYKILKIATGEAELFLLSKGTTYKWDTCAPQAILRSMNGDLFDLQDTLINKSVKKISYHDHKVTRNIGGLIAYQNIDKLREFLKL
ncbi:AGAP001047-PB [Anopheles gambiae str. PEST]|uniref:inositol-1,4-bisphosphate 1-phosphatase n=2 Tax=gambiae species complex TaxID=44542 RepID=Q7Q2G8_ANOGA|nr:inositol polyphosphate 1-phosphatase [Anopheles coluzzii]XP_040228981.1 inositol polyphosphate 1-phosphatase [Anopheles coluzzii]XP_040228987.1 inositol polyphosphate 1-phosphatase [Anopheles coluzzii]EAA13432.4 AGAP001047-PA [Anopheles gambiae str. PEST]EGK97316.1 AGAP001047-PB [Anopheles gambiae str. PEST]